MSVSLVSQNLPVSHTFLAGGAKGYIALSESRVLEVRDITDSKSLSTIGKTVKIWKELVMDRVGESRGKDNREKTEDSHRKRESDEKAASDFKELLEMFNSILKIKKPDDENIVKVLQDQDGNIQGMCSAKLEEGSIYVRHLFAAPWNLKMHGAIEESHQSLVTQGVGTILLASLHREGLEQKKGMLTLKPLTGSVTYYRDYLKMQHDASTDRFSYPIAETREFPEPLRVALSKISPYIQ